MSATQSSDRDAILLRKLRDFIWSEDNQSKFDPDQFCQRWFSELELVAAKSGKPGPGGLVFRFSVQKQYLNANQQYAGGAQAAVHDACTGWALLTIMRPNFWSQYGASRTLGVSFLKSAGLGDVLRLECQITHLTSRMALIRGTLVREADGELISTCEHHMVNNDRLPASL